MLDKTAVTQIMNQFALSFSDITNQIDKSRGAEDLRYIYVLDERYVLKVNFGKAVWESRLREIARLIARYRSIGVFCPRYIPMPSGNYSCVWRDADREFVCYVEEFARFPICPEGFDYDEKEVLAHLGDLAARYSGVDLWKTVSMWSIIDFPPLCDGVDEKQENTDLLVTELKKAGLPGLAEDVARFNEELRSVIQKDYRELPRCVYQGDLNSTNILLDDGHFAGLIDFNLSGTEVNINCFLNETQWFPETKELDALTVSEILEKMDTEQDDKLSVILDRYALNALEKRLLPYYKRLIDLFQYPNVCALAHWLKDPARKEKAAALITGLLQKPLT